MSQKWKTHFIAITVIVTVILAVYALTTPKQAAAPVDPETVGDRAIEVYSATWGMECNQTIQAMLEERRTKPPAVDGQGKPIPLEPLELIQKDNALIRVGGMCNGRNSCSITATDATLELKTPSSCNRKLLLAYRCYSYDRLWNLVIQQGETKKIDCNAAATEPSSK